MPISVEAPRILSWGPVVARRAEFALQNRQPPSFLESHFCLLQHLQSYLVAKSHST